MSSIPYLMQSHLDFIDEQSPLPYHSYSFLQTLGHCLFFCTVTSSLHPQ
jgi:hypothetical protein